MYRIPSEELRLACRQKLETCELWLRRLIHEELSQRFGENYFTDGAHDGNPLFRSDVRQHAAQRMGQHPQRYTSEVDTLLFDHLVDTLCKQNLYKLCFSSSLGRAFPGGAEEARRFLHRLVAIRNALSHANPVTVHDAERVLCYCDDVIEALKDYYKEKNTGKEYDAPMFVRFSDSAGHSQILSTPSEMLDYRADRPLRPGDQLRLEVEVDASFDPSAYRVKWNTNAPGLGADIRTGPSYVLKLRDRHVNEFFRVEVDLTSNRQWHRFGTHDADLKIMYKVLPPVSPSADTAERG
ncbi:MAG: hypothetical protein ACLQVF_11115 [Isosphaeraceae bacterium]